MLTVLGSGYVLLSLLLGHGHFDDAGHAGHVAHGTAHETHMTYGVKGEGHSTAGGSAGGTPAFHFPFFSPLALATLFAAIGGWGLIAQHGFGVAENTSLLIAIPAAVITAYAVTYAGFRLVSGSTGSSQIRTSDLEGAMAEVITPIPAGGMGEVAAMVNGQRFSGPAREAAGKAVARGAHVRVRSLVGSTFIVEEKEG